MIYFVLMGIGSFVVGVAVGIYIQYAARKGMGVTTETKKKEKNGNA